MRARILFPLLLALAFPVSAGALAAPASLEDIILLGESGVSDETIRVFLSSRPVDFDLDADAIARLKEAGISEENIQFLLDIFGEQASEADKEVVVVVAPDPYPHYYYGSYYIAGAFPHWGFHFSFPFHFPIPVPHLSHTRHRVLRHDTVSHHLHHRTSHRASHNDGHRRHRESGHSVRHVSRRLDLAGDHSTGRQSRGHAEKRSRSKAHKSRSGRQHTAHASRGHGDSKHASRASRGHGHSKHASRAHAGKSRHSGGKHRGRH